MIMLAKLRTEAFCDAWSASCPDWISSWSELAAWAMYPGENSGLFGSTGAGGGVLEQAASASAPPNRIPIFLIEVSPFLVQWWAQRKPAETRSVPNVYPDMSGEEVNDLRARCSRVEQQAAVAMRRIALEAQERARNFAGKLQHLRRSRHRLGQLELTL
jgi:hypothetical protein